MESSNPQQFEWTPKELEAVGPIQSDHVDFTEYVKHSKTMEMTLPSDPVALGLSEFHRLIHTCQELKNHLSTMISDVISVKGTWDIYHGRILRIYNTRKGMYLSDSVIKALKNVEQQVAACNSRMIPIVELLQYTEEVLNYIDSVLKVLRQREATLQDTKDNLSRQITVVGQQIETGEIPRDWGPTRS